MGCWQWTLLDTTDFLSFPLEMNGVIVYIGSTPSAGIGCVVDVHWPNRWVGRSFPLWAYYCYTILFSHGGNLLFVSSKATYKGFPSATLPLVGLPTSPVFSRTRVPSAGDGCRPGSACNLTIHGRVLIAHQPSAPMQHHALTAANSRWRVPFSPRHSCRDLVSSPFFTYLCVLCNLFLNSLTLGASWKLVYGLPCP